MRISRTDLMFYIFAAFSILLAFYTVVIHIKFQFLPVFFLIFGVLSSLLPGGRDIKIFIFLLPLINSLPGFFFNGYPYNLMALVLFFLSGIVIGSMLKKMNPDFNRFKWSGSYLLFLSILWISALFVLLRWSNLTISPDAFFADTPVGPGIPQSPRNSFATIFPVITLFLFSVTPFIASLIRKHRLREAQIFNLLIAGYSFSVLFAIFQKYFDSGFMAMKWWGDKLNQFNGGFSDFNGFGFFGGVIFLYSTLRIIRNFSAGPEKLLEGDGRIYIFSFIISYYGVILSGSRTAFIFVIFAVIFLVLSRVRPLIKIFIPVILMIILLLSGGILIKRLDHTLDTVQEAAEKKDILQTLDKFSNGRVQMIRNSAQIILKYPFSGIGTGNFLFYLKYLKYGEKFLEDMPLNQYLLIVDELGFIGLSIFLLFLYLILRRKDRGDLYKIMAVILAVMAVGNSLWLPEIFVLFWIVTAFLGKTGPEGYLNRARLKKMAYILIPVFIIFNVISFSSLHPSKLMREKGLDYNYGFWPESKKTGFAWTKDKAGMLLKLDGKGESGPLRFFCGAPLDRLPGRFQVLNIYNGKKIADSKRFTSNEEHIIFVKGDPGEVLFLRIEVDPVFNLKKMGLGDETRGLGVQFFPGAFQE